MKPSADDIPALQMQLKDLERRAAGLESELQALRGSTSWRITAPLRGLVRGLRWLKGPLPSLLHRLWAKARASTQRYGWRGVMRRLPHYTRRAVAMARAASQPGQHANTGAAVFTPVPLRLHPDLCDDVAQLPRIDITVSVIIPTLNAGPEFAFLLRKLRTQRAVRAIEILVLDSGSSDATTALALAASARVIPVAPGDFSHSGTRNLGADHATGDYLLFMVQDAYPIGDHWLHGLLRYHLDHADEGLVALSCTEYCRDDSDLMYECNIATYYRFLGCKDVDRIAGFQGANHESLRTMGQLSDIACLIPRVRFQQYRYRGSFAEDIDLGVRLIQDGHRVAMLASVKVIHSHYRAAYYYLKRSFVDIVFLKGAFADFTRPRHPCSVGLVAGAVWVANAIPQLASAMEDAPPAGSAFALCNDWLSTLRTRAFEEIQLSENRVLNDPRTETLLRDLVRDSQVVARAEPADFAASARAFIQDFLARLDFFNHYARDVYGGNDAHVMTEWRSAVDKVFAASLGALLADLHLDRNGLAKASDERQWLDRVAQQLTAGV